MLFTYTYRSSDGARHAAEVEAESRDAAFAKLRFELGIKPIKVVAADSEKSATPRRNRGLLLGLAVLVGIAASVLLVWRYESRRTAMQFTVNTPQGPVTYTIASPLPRQTIPGDRRRIENSEDIFSNSAERVLARFAEPGRMVAALGDRPADADFEACFNKPIRIASTDFTEVVDIKRIVTGMKREMRAYLAGGGTVSAYLAELEKRQRLEISYRGNAERRLNELLDVQNAEPPLKEAYNYWLKANAQLQAMGIYPLALPDMLRSYQMGLDIEK